jgi:hypothetical protein
MCLRNDERGKTKSRSVCPVELLLRAATSFNLVLMGIVDFNSHKHMGIVDINDLLMPGIVDIRRILGFKMAQDTSNPMGYIMLAQDSNLPFKDSGLIRLLNIRLGK